MNNNLKTNQNGQAFSQIHAKFPRECNNPVIDQKLTVRTNRYRWNHKKIKALKLLIKLIHCIVIIDLRPSFIIDDKN